MIHYPVPSGRIKGHYVMPPRDVARMKAIIREWTKVIQRRGYDEYSFPQVGLVSDLQREKNFVAFTPQVFKISPEHYLAPTGELIMYPLLFQDRRRLKMRYYQVGTVFRRQSEACVYLRRHRQIRYFFQMHALFPTEAQLLEEMDYLKTQAIKFCKKLGLCVRIHQRTAQDRFPGARKTIAFDTVLRSGKAIQVLTLHDLGDSFSKNLSEVTRFQLCLGFSERLLGALQDHYGDRLCEVHNPYEVITLSHQDLQGKTLKTVAESHQVFYDSKYTLMDGYYRHRRSGARLDKRAWRHHRRSSQKTAITQTMAEIENLLNIYITTSNKRCCLGFTPDGLVHYVDKKV